MIVVAGEMVIEAGDVDAVVPAALEMMRASNAEAGCRHYRFYADLEHAGAFHVYEEWDSLDDLQAHVDSPHMAIWRAALAKVTVVSRDIKRFEAGPSTAL